MPAPPWRGCHIWGQMCAWQIPNLHESPLVLPGWGWELLCNSPTEAGSRIKTSLIWAGLLGSFQLRLLSEGSEASAPQTPPTFTILPPARGLLGAVATQSLQTRVGGRQQQSQSTEREGPSGAVRPQTEKLPHRTCMRTEGSLARAAEAQLPGSKQNRFLRADEGSEGAKG